MHPAHATHPASQATRLMSALSAKRWGRWVAFAWMLMWLSAALLPCSEVAAAMAKRQQVAHEICGQPGGKVPDSSGSQKHKPCLSISAPTSASTARPAATGSTPVTPLGFVSASSYVLSSRPGLSLPIAYRAAPPPVAVYLRSLRLRI